MAKLESLPPVYVHTWMRNMITRAPLHMAEPLNLFESIIVKDLNLVTLEPGHALAELKVAPHLVVMVRAWICSGIAVV